jgi:hypothetical protein
LTTPLNKPVTARAYDIAKPIKPALKNTNQS